MKRALLAVVLAGAGLYAAWYALSTPYRNFTGEQFVMLDRGLGTRAMAERLAEAGVIRAPWEFLAIRALHPSAKLQAGEYLFVNPASAREVFSRIAQGDVYTFDFTVPEGSNMFDIARLAEAAGISSADMFLRAAADPAAVRDLDPAAKSLEGYLFPSTYRLSHSAGAEQLCRMMTQQFRKEWEKIAGKTGAAIHDSVTLASMVEKETGVNSERPLVAAVFANRLKQGVRLECDPTTIYAALLEHRYRGVIHRSDLASPNPYNTYRHDGLPPGPIANPGVQSLEAALHPAEADYLYFVARPDGNGHVFSSTLAAHEKAVQSYRHATKAQKTKG